jgi:hypothetical protein
VLVFGDEDGGFDVVPYCWLPGETLDEREDEDRMPYQALGPARAHLLTFQGQRTTDPKAVALKIAELHGLYNIQGLAFDRWRIEDIQRELAAIGCDVQLVPWGQGYKDMSAGRGRPRAPRRGAQAPARDAPGFDDGGLERQGRDRRGAEPEALEAQEHGAVSTHLVALTMALGIASRHEAVPEWSPLAEVV